MAGNPASPRVDPLHYEVPIVEPPTGKPTQFFTRQWQALIDIIYDVGAATTVAAAAQSTVNTLIDDLGDLAYEDNAAGVPYDNTTSNLAATNVQAAIDEVSANNASCSPRVIVTSSYTVTSANPCGTIFVGQ